jgi:hypothetical protein
MSHCPNTLHLRTSYFVCFVCMCTHVCLCTMHSSLCAGSMDKTFSFWAPAIRHQFFVEDNVKRHEPEHECNVRKCNTLRLDESYRLVTTVLVQKSHSRKIQNILLSTIGVQQRKVFSRDEHL